MRIPRERHTPQIASNTGAARHRSTPTKTRNPLNLGGSAGFGSGSRLSVAEAARLAQARAWVLPLALAFFAGAAAGASAPLLLAPLVFELALEPSKSAASFFERLVFSQVNSLRPKCP